MYDIILFVLNFVVVLSLHAGVHYADFITVEANLRTNSLKSTTAVLSSVKCATSCLAAKSCAAFSYDKRTRCCDLYQDHLQARSDADESTVLTNLFIRHETLPFFDLAVGKILLNIDANPYLDSYTYRWSS